jgi:hypothetical protein
MSGQIVRKTINSKPSKKNRIFGMYPKAVITKVDDDICMNPSKCYNLLKREGIKKSGEYGAQLNNHRFSTLLWDWKKFDF